MASRTTSAGVVRPLLVWSSRGRLSVTKHRVARHGASESNSPVRLRKLNKPTSVFLRGLIGQKLPRAENSCPKRTSSLMSDGNTKRRRVENACSHAKRITLPKWQLLTTCGSTKNSFQKHF